MLKQSLNLKRLELLDYALKLEENQKISDRFKRDFLEFLEKILLNLMDREDSFFGSFMLKVKREIKFNISSPIVTKPTIEGFYMYFNPILFLNCEVFEMEALIKHEIYHIMLSHYERERILRIKYPSIVINIAMDISVNQFIKKLPMWCMTVERVNKEYSLMLKKDSTIEIYCEELYKKIKSKESNNLKVNSKKGIVKEIDYEDCHELWNEDNISIENLKEIKKKTAISSYKGKGPQTIIECINNLNEKAEIGWAECLKRMIPKVRNGYKKTITRKDRRLPERLDLRGKLPSKAPSIILAIDISASITDEEYNKIILEVVSIAKSRAAKILLIQCDDDVRSVQSIKKIKDIEGRVKKGGSTKFTPVFRYIKDNNLKDSILIYFTDGVGEAELEFKPVNKRTIWVLTGQELSLKKPYGQIKRLTRIQKESYGNTYGLEAVREVIHDWAR